MFSGLATTRSYQIYMYCFHQQYYPNFSYSTDDERRQAVMVEGVKYLDCIIIILYFLNLMGFYFIYYREMAANNPVNIEKNKSG